MGVVRRVLVEKLNGGSSKSKETVSSLVRKNDRVHEPEGGDRPSCQAMPERITWLRSSEGVVH